MNFLHNALINFSPLSVLSYDILIIYFNVKLLTTLLSILVVEEEWIKMFETVLIIQFVRQYELPLEDKVFRNQFS